MSEESKREKIENDKAFDRAVRHMREDRLKNKENEKPYSYNTIITQL